MLLSHARSLGVSVHQLTKVTAIHFSSEDHSKPTSLSWSHIGSSSLETESPISGITTFDYLFDASGRVGIMSTKYLKNRHFNASLKNVAVWGYWKNGGTYGIMSSREGAPWFEALTGICTPKIS